MAERLLICVAFMASALLLLSSPSHAATFQVCNKSKERVSVAIGYDDKDLGMVSEGWWKLPIGDCVNIVPADRKDHQFYFLYAKGGAGDNWSSFDESEADAFCVTRKDFKIINRRFETNDKLDCARYGASTIKFRRLDTLY